MVAHDVLVHSAGQAIHLVSPLDIAAPHPRRQYSTAASLDDRPDRWLTTAPVHVGRLRHTPVMADTWATRDLLVLKAAVECC